MTDVSLKYEELMNKVLQHFAAGPFREELKKAKLEFFDQSGVVDEHSPNFELRMSQFFDWYFYTRELTGYSKTPLEVYHMARELRFTPEELEMIVKMKEHRHSLFEFIKIKGNDIYIKDLFKGDKLIVKQCPWIYGFEGDEYFEARLIPYGDSYLFTKGFCFHPAEARKFILSEIKRHKKDTDLDPELLMLKLNYMRYRYERYKHVKADRIYTFEDKAGV